MAIATGVAVGLAASASAQANAAASRARDAECKLTLANYSNIKTPTVHEQREYAGCVYRIHGNGVPMKHEDVILVKIILVALIVSWIVGLIRERPDGGYYSNTYLDTFMLSILYPIGLAFVGFILFLVFAAIMIIINW